MRNIALLAVVASLVVAILSAIAWAVSQAFGGRDYTLFLGIYGAAVALLAVGLWFIWLPFSLKDGRTASEVSTLFVVGGGIALLAFL